MMRIVPLVGAPGPPAYEMSVVLPEAIRTNQPVGLACEDGHIEVINRSEFTKLFDELLDPPP